MQKWDINDPAAEAPQQFNIVIARHLSQTAQDLPSALAAIYNATAENGFVVLQELVGPFGAAVFGLSKPSWQYSDGREFGPSTSVAHWQKLLANAGFVEISTVRCAPDVLVLLMPATLLTQHDIAAMAAMLCLPALAAIGCVSRS